MSKQTHKFMEGQKVYGKIWHWDSARLYAKLDEMGYVWSQKRQKWLKTVDDNQTPLQHQNEVLVDRESMTKIGLIMLPCQYCNSGVLCEAYDTVGLTETNQKVHVIAHFGLCPNCHREHQTVIDYSEAISRGMLQDMPKIVNKKPKNRWH